jgi:hypothetical protein
MNGLLPVSPYRFLGELRGGVRGDGELRRRRRPVTMGDDPCRRGWRDDPPQYGEHLLFFTP